MGKGNRDGACCSSREKAVLFDVGRHRAMSMSFSLIMFQSLMLRELDRPEESFR